MEKINSLDIKESKLLKIAILTSIVIVLFWILPFVFYKFIPDEGRGTYGDVFGIVNSLFSGLALAGIILTILLQRNELSLQRQELINTREELKRTANAQENSEKALNRQAENLKISAKLSALNTLVSFYSELEMNLRKGIPNPGSSLDEVVKKKNLYVLRIEQILERKEAFL